MNCIISFAAEGIIRDVKTNNISAFNILERIASPGFPLFIQRMFFFSLIEKGDEVVNRSELRLLINNNQQTLVEIPISLDFQDKSRIRQIVEIGSIPIPAPGKLSYHLMQEEKQICEYSVVIELVGKPLVKKLEE